MLITPPKKPAGGDEKNPQQQHSEQANKQRVLDLPLPRIQEKKKPLGIYTMVTEVVSCRPRETSQSRKKKERDQWYPKTS